MTRVGQFGFEGYTEKSSPGMAWTAKSDMYCTLYSINNGDTERMSRLRRRDGIRGQVQNIFFYCFSRRNYTLRVFVRIRTYTCGWRWIAANVFVVYKSIRREVYARDKLFRRRDGGGSQANFPGSTGNPFRITCDRRRTLQTNPTVLGGTRSIM